jgi:hypothetical protein
LSIFKVCGKGGKQHHRFPGFPSDRHFHGLRRQSLRRTMEVYLLGRLASQAGVRAPRIEELDVARYFLLASPIDS